MLRRLLNLNYRILVRMAGDGILNILLFPLTLYYLTLYRVLRFKFKTVAIKLSRFPGNTGILLRRQFYRQTLAQCGKHLWVHYGAFFVYPEAEVGDRCLIEEYCIASLCKMGNDVILAARVSIMSGAHHHEVDDLTKTFHESTTRLLQKVVLGDNLWIGTHAVIMADVAPGTVVGAGAVVTKTFPPNAVIGGVPARLIRLRGERAAQKPATV